MTTSDIELRIKLAREMGAKVEENDYGWTVGVIRADGKATLISEVWRSELDGYTGWKLIDMDVLKDWLSK